VVQNILSAILNSVIVITCLFLICLILIQRGKGGGLAGAFGGVGGSSAFGTKAGDVFTRVTMVVATVWIVLSMILVVLYNRKGVSAFDSGAPSSTSASKDLSSKASRTKAADSAVVPPVPVPAGSAVPVPAGSAAPATSAAPSASAAEDAPAAKPATGIPAIPDVPPPAAPK